MRSVLRPLPALALAPALVLTGCDAPTLELRPSERLEDLLLTADDYPEGYSLESIDVEDLEDTSTGADDIGAVEPAECARVMDGGSAEIPEGAVEGAAQSATSDDPAFFMHMVVSGDLGADALDTSDYDALLRDCSQMTITSEGITLDAALESMSSPSLPETGDMFALSMEGEGMEMVMTTAWGQVDDVFFALLHMDMAPGADAVPTMPHGEAREACTEEENPVPCMTDAREAEQEQADAEARQEAREEFERVLAAAVERLENA
ncbi:hypothetical protein DFP74_5157 [Nocardiopsis sp. Huas11]|uniref:hypothetical protein n=1 Tax=Nocardiopsis sp. Huas11 TaxID=2183912 RepID=UPI000EAC7540|nr:hypothetical protein [Nocardiopsis sp. Huas11]RKS09421.1 hypothetical protein DFP74_5157 [Nocardiopsis sp. Huas11]